MNAFQLLDAGELLARIAERVPAELCDNVVVIGSIATAWAFRDISGHATVATKDIDLLLRPAIEATATAETLAQQLLHRDWQPIYPNDRQPGTADTPDDELPALRLSPPGEREGWFVELLGAPQPDQAERRSWRRFKTPIGVFALPCFRCMPVAIHAAEQTKFGIRTARPARMALAHLLEHAEPDTTPISNLPGTPPRFTKDVGRAVSLWWLAQEQSSAADEEWLDEWRETLAALHPNQQALKKQDAARGLASVRDYLHEAHAIAVRSVLAPHGTTFEAWGRAHADLEDLIQQISRRCHRRPRRKRSLMTDTNPAKFKKLVTLLRELFQLDQPDLDFGIYRIMHAKAGEVTQFLERDLLPQVKDAFSQYQSADSAELKRKLDQMVAQLTEAGVDPDTAPKVRELREQMKGAIDIGALENEVYDHLNSFFRRYYSEGDFLAKRVYKPGVYAIPYEGEEVTLHWANKDQYYIKTSEYLRDYAFRLRAEAAEGQDPMRVHLRLVDAAEGEHGNVKAAEGKDRVFVLAKEDFIGLSNGELDIRFEYRPATLEDWPEGDLAGKKKPPAQKEITALAVERILASGADFKDWLAELKRPHVKTDGEQAGYTRLEAHLRRYTARNTFDYFIHKDLGGFLRRELDFYIKNEVMHLDDVENETAPKVEQYLSKIKVIRRIAGKLIDFLAQLENFQKKLWLKKKFVVGADWLVAISQVPEELFPHVCANTAQLEEWNTLHSLRDLPADVTRPAYSAPLTPEYLRAHPSLLVDTKYFDAAFVTRLMEATGDIDEKADGVLVQSENFQALSLMQSRYREKVQCVFIDPPYNTGGDGFAYKDAYQHSSWLAMLDSRLVLAHGILANNGTFISNIDEHEHEHLSLILDQHFKPENRIGSLVWKGATDNNPTRIAIEHEYLLCFAKDKTHLDEHWSTRTSQQKELMLDAYSRIRKSAASVDVIAEKFAEFAAENRDELGDLYRYRRVDGVGPYAARRNMDNPGKRGYDFDVIHPVTEKPCARPYWGWRFPPKTMERLLVEDRIIFGDTEEKLPELKVYLSEVKFPLRSMFSLDARKGSNDLDRLFGARDIFKNPKPVELITYVVPFMTTRDALLADFFAGSGTTGHAIINMNRQDAGSRKFVLIETGEHFDPVLVPRLKKVAFTPEWKDGRPVRVATTEEAGRSPRLIKIQRLESYEDTLNNLALSRSAQQQAAMDFSAAKGGDGLREQYLLRYQLDVESRGSASLLNVRAFGDPTAYKLKVKTPGSDESREVNVDLLETFNWLLGLTVEQITAPRSFQAEFERDQEGRLQLKGRLRQVADGPFWFRTVTGTTPEGRKTLVVWRKLTGEPEKDNVVLEEWFKNKQAYSVRDTEFDLIYVNGDNTLENLRVDPETWKVRLIEEDFHRLMFEGTES